MTCATYDIFSFSSADKCSIFVEAGFSMTSPDIATPFAASTAAVDEPQPSSRFLFWLGFFSSKLSFLCSTGKIFLFSTPLFSCETEDAKLSMSCASHVKRAQRNHAIFRSLRLSSILDQTAFLFIYPIPTLHRSLLNKLSKHK